MKKIILIAAIILLSNSCATTTPVTIVLNCPPPIVLPTLSQKQAAQMETFISAETYHILVSREMLLKARIDTLCGIIESTH